MSQYLNIYIKAKGHNEPMFLAQYSRNSEVYETLLPRRRLYHAVVTARRIVTSRA